MTKNNTKELSNQKLLIQWLAETRFPEDAQALINGEKDYSMTWLNYAIIDVKKDDYRIQTMVIAQYYYAAQELRNRELKLAIAESQFDQTLKKVEKLLSQSRLSARLLQIEYHEHLKLLTRVKRNLLSDILDGWEFQILIDNSERMIDICSSRLEQADNKRRERSTVMTDLLLVALSFFAVFELCLFLVQFSREMMSRPALDYNDTHSSFFLSAIAEVDTDIMFGIGVCLTMSLIAVYKHIKEN